METAIRRAIEGGWKFRGTNSIRNFTSEHLKSAKIVTLDLSEKGTQAVCLASIYELLYDPLFWQALGKAMGWNDPNNFTKGLDTLRAASGLRWLIEWHKFIDWIAEGKSPDDFFNSLFTQK